MITTTAKETLVRSESQTPLQATFTGDCFKSIYKNNIALALTVEFFLCKNVGTVPEETCCDCHIVQYDGIGRGISAACVTWRSILRTSVSASSPAPTACNADTTCQTPSTVVRNTRHYPATLLQEGEPDMQGNMILRITFWQQSKWNVNSECDGTGRESELFTLRCQA